MLRLDIIWAKEERRMLTVNNPEDLSKKKHQSDCSEEKEKTESLKKDCIGQNLPLNQQFFAFWQQLLISIGSKFVTVQNI